MTVKTAVSKAPGGAKLEVLITIDQDQWGELKSQGYSDEDIQKAIENSIILTDIVGGEIVRPPVLDVVGTTLLKYY